MGDHFVLLVDRLLTESTLEAAIESRNPSKQSGSAENNDVVIDCASHSDSEIGFAPRKVVECRICQDEDFDSKMETPCSCRGSLKIFELPCKSGRLKFYLLLKNFSGPYAHRRCVQKWCNEKGNTMCEICHQQFTPNYTAPPPLFRFGGIPMNLRGSWQISRRDLNNPRLVAMVSTHRNFLSPTYDEYADSSSRSLICFRLVVAIFMVLLILRHAVPIFATGSDNFSFPLFVLPLLRILGILLPVYIILKALHGRRRQRQATSVSSVRSDDEEADDVAILQNQPESIQVP